MKILIALVLVFLIGGFLGANLSHMGLNIRGQLLSDGSDGSDGSDSQEPTPLYWVAPMDKNFRRDAPGLSPMGMDLVPVYADEDNGEAGLVKISSAVENNLGVKTAKVRRSTLYQTIDSVGVVEFDEAKIQHIHSRVEGWIEMLNVSAVGDRVKKGQTLYELYSPALVNAQEEFLAALRSGNSNLIKASKSRLVSLGLSEEQVLLLQKRRKVDQRIKVLSKINGVVTRLTVRHGMFIRPDTELLSIASLDTIWVIAEVFERQAGLVNSGQPVELWFNAYPGRSWEGKVDYIYPELDETTRTLSLRIQLDNSQGMLKPNMLANLRIASYIPEPSLFIPQQALIKANQHHRVVKALGDGRYQSVLVNTGIEGFAVAEGSDDSSSPIHSKNNSSIHSKNSNSEPVPVIQVIDGLNAGDDVVTSAQFLIDSESNIDAELARMESQSIAIHDKSMPHKSMNHEGMSHESMNHEGMSHEGMSHETKPTKEKAEDSVMGKGTINSVMAGHNMLNITHKPIPEWGWPEMSMNFDVDASLNLTNLQQDERINFKLIKNAEGAITITEIFPMDGSSELSKGAAK